ncbi:3-methyl-2-oxobutanoate hydroxymethyltransferase [Thermanaerovibrio velox DSM 12556]|uniref:3-methyl-2-oxobutanoate hydroxymethyltransferase n=1 Tax=Thermanaerovibrio velox DSM 12556 TaxID=926567 RepID=H0UNP9_9BACT|nr:3-methyl-2-oxobutanoate hydroxymethyltransferase [Thermanaerovibrio velox]EHM10464.1 3-methyl-2-oxobutanoate hydroxymethyltransferase [Thermanaerovibrio velox DSM 12556]
MENRKVSIPDLHAMKAKGEKIVMHTAYNHWQAQMAEEAGADTILVGDSVGMVEHGFSSTVPVTMEMMLLHCSAVVRGAKRPFIIGDMPFLSYEVSPEEAVRNAGRLIKEAGVDAVKLEGGRSRRDTISAIVRAGIPVVGHVGLTPQSATQLGGFKVQGKDRERARQVLEDAVSVQEAGACMVVLECIPTPLARLITERLSIPTIGIGAGPFCDGQVLVFHDLLGIFNSFKPKFVKRYLNGRETLVEALSRYTQEVRSQTFPEDQHGFSMDASDLEGL